MSDVARDWPEPPAWELDWSRFASLTDGASEDDLRDALTGGIVAPFDWPSWAERVGAPSWVDDPDRLARLSLVDVRRLLTAMVRSDRFNEGSLAELLDRGVIAAVRDRVRTVLAGGAARRGVLEVAQADITTLDFDAIVNAANERMLGGGGVDGAIHRAAGPMLVEACHEVEEVRPGVRCPTGQARVTPGFDLPARWVVHTVGPRWHGGNDGEPDLLASAYRESLLAAGDVGARTVAFPAISTGVFGYPPDAAARVAVGTCLDVLADHREAFDRIVLTAFSPADAAVLTAALGAARA